MTRPKQLPTLAPLTCRSAPCGDPIAVPGVLPPCDRMILEVVSGEATILWEHDGFRDWEGSTYCTEADARAEAARRITDGCAS